LFPDTIAECISSILFASRGSYDSLGSLEAFLHLFKPPDSTSQLLSPTQAVLFN